MDIELKDTQDKGLGVYAARNFKKGESVLTFHGALINESLEHTLQLDYNEHLLVNAPEKYVNHSCAPNCGIKDKRTLVAIKPIKKGEEINFDYAMTEFSIDETECLCGAVNCRGKITGFDKLPEDFKKRYRGFISDYLLKN